MDAWVDKYILVILIVINITIKFLNYQELVFFL